MANDMDMITLDSKALAAVGYDPSRRVLRIRFGSGKVYEYQDVSPYKFKQLVNSDTPGSYFGRSIRPKHHYRDLSWRTLPARAAAR